MARGKQKAKDCRFVPGAVELSWGCKLRKHATGLDQQCMDSLTTKDATALAHATSSSFILLSSLQSITTGTGTPTDVAVDVVVAGEAAPPFQDDRRRRLAVPSLRATGTAASFAACRAFASKAMAD